MSTQKPKKSFRTQSTARYGPLIPNEIIDERTLKDTGPIDVSSVLKRLKTKKERLCSICDKEVVQRRCYPCKCANTCTVCSSKAYKKFILQHKKDPKKYPTLPFCLTCNKYVRKTKDITLDRQMKQIEESEEEKSINKKDEDSDKETKKQPLKKKPIKKKDMESQKKEKEKDEDQDE